MYLPSSYYDTYLRKRQRKWLQTAEKERESKVNAQHLIIRQYVLYSVYFSILLMIYPMNLISGLKLHSCYSFEKSSIVLVIGLCGFKAQLCHEQIDVY